MFSYSRSLLLVLRIFQCYTMSKSEVMTSFCLSRDVHYQPVKVPTTPRVEYTEQQHHTTTSQGGSRPNPDECCVSFSFTLPSSKPSARHEDTRVTCQEHVHMINTLGGLCEDRDTEWLQKVIKAYDWCLMNGYAPKQDGSVIVPMSIYQFLDANTRQGCCYLFHQTQAKFFTTQDEKLSNVCELITFNVTLPMTRSDCSKRWARDFIGKTYNCLEWGFSGK